MKLRRYVLFIFTTIIAVFLISSCTGLTDSDSNQDNGTEQLQEFSSVAPPGDSARSFLSDQQFDELNLEIDYMPGYEPTERALDSLESFLKKYLNKSTINIESPTRIEAGEQNAYSGEDIRNLEEEHRDNYTSYDNPDGETLWAYFIFVDGEYDQQNVLGVAYYNTSMAFFGPTIHNNSGDIGQADRYKLEATVFNHEFGHNMGLVANGSPMQENHQDSGNGHHCTEDNCLMYYAVETTDYTSILVDSPIPDLLEYCQADVQANGGK